ncbi:MAG: PQQ-binding-like beta-propeller repeat protein [Pirellulaceae bacterium]
MSSDFEQETATSESISTNGRKTRLQRVRSFLAGVAYTALVVVIVACPVGIVVLRWRAESIGFDVANVGTFVLGFLALLALIPLILLQSHVRLLNRLLAVSVVVILIWAPFLTLRVQGFDGRLMPIVRWRWAPEQEELPEAPEISADQRQVDLATRTPDDFPQFLGPGRNADLPHVQLKRDWKAHSPTLLWRRPIGAGWSSISAVNGYAVTMEQRREKEIVTCYSIDSGEVKWARGHAARHETVMGGVGPRSTPTIHEGFVYALGATGYLSCLDGATGELVWDDDLRQRCGVTKQQDLAAVSWGRAASPLVAHDLLVVPLGGPREGTCYSLIAYDKTSGDVRWMGGDQQISYASPSLETLCGREQIVIVNENAVSGHRLDDGQVLWSYDWEGQSNGEPNCSQAVVLSDNRVLLTNRRKAELIQLEPAANDSLRAKSIWLAHGKLKTKFTNVVVRDGYIYGLSDGILECVELATGQRCWKSRRGNYGHGQILGVGDVILVQAESGHVVMVEFNPDQLVELGRFEALSERTWNNPCLFGSTLLVRNASEIACYRLPLRQ